MTSERSLTSGNDLPPEWLAAVDRFEDQLAAGSPPQFASCLRLAERNSAGLLVELVAIYQSFRALRGGDLSTCVAELLHANPDLSAEIARAVGEISLSSVVRPTAGKTKPSDLPRARGNYLLLDSLGQGGFGEVYLGCNAASAEFVVAKVARSGGGVAEAARETLRNEKDALLRLRGVPGVAKFLEWISDEEDGDTLFMEFVPAAPLNQRRKHQRPSVSQTVRWMIGLCETLHAAHRAQVYHCDVKPHNILIDERTDRPILIDFGLSQTLFRWSREAPGPAPPVGTMHYLAPELLRDPDGADPQLVDTFGLGAVMYFIATGTSPFGAATAELSRLRVESYDLDFAALDAAPMPAELVAICRRALALSPRERFSSPAELLDALQSTAVARAANRPNRKTLLFGATIATTSVVVAWGMLTAGEAEAPPRGLDASASQRPTESVLHRIAAEQGIDLATITSADLRPRILSGRRSERTGEIEEFEVEDRGKLVVDFDRRLTDIMHNLQYRIVPGMWKPLFTDSDTDIRYAELDARDLELDGPLELRIGGPAMFDGSLVEGEILLGPFRYGVSLRQALADDDAALHSERIAAAQTTPWHEPGNAVWTMSMLYEEQFHDLIKEFRFGARRDALDHVASSAQRRVGAGYDPNYPLPSTLSLAESFNQVVEDIEEAPELWVQIEFVDGSQSEPRSYRRENRFGHDGSVEGAKRLLAELSPGSPIAHFAGRLLVLDGLARVDRALKEIQWGPSPDALVYRVPCSQGVGGDALSLKNGGSSQGHIARVLQEPSFAFGPLPATTTVDFYDGLATNAIRVPFVWRSVALRGVFTDGTTTAVYEVPNSRPATGFAARLVRVAPGGVPIPLEVLLARDRFTSSEDSGDSSGGTLAVRVDAALPPHAQAMELYADPELRQPIDTVRAGTVYVKFVAADGRQVSACAYSIDAQAFRALQSGVQEEQRRSRGPSFD